MGEVGGKKGYVDPRRDSNVKSAYALTMELIFTMFAAAKSR